MSIADQFWQYAREALLSACEAKTADDRKGLLELAQTWTQAALVERHSLIDNEIADRKDCRIRQPPEFSTLLISPQCPLSAINRYSGLNWQRPPRPLKAISSTRL
jgi:hypothetical protein